MDSSSKYVSRKKNVIRSKAKVCPARYIPDLLSTGNILSKIAGNIDLAKTEEMNTNTRIDRGIFDKLMRKLKELEQIYCIMSQIT